MSKRKAVNLKNLTLSKQRLFMGCTELQKCSQPTSLQWVRRRFFRMQYLCRVKVQV